MRLMIALALILHPTDGTILIAQRKAGVHQELRWEFPGGKCLDGETPEACAVRETWEETGLMVTVLESWPPIIHKYPERTVHLSPFLCRAHSADAAARESRQIAWVTPSELSGYDFPDANAPLLARLEAINPRGFTG